ncbi:MAG: nitroreductase [Pseudohongiella sp.]|nr:nitroreductase [Pseudohongiella sp.]MDO9520664.1 nitroreductase [Pseudohongiella sp.]MDP2127934.1 nitroreductase [Pseudohongiella sp.]
MDALTALQTRVSVSRVREPGPDKQTLEQIIKAGLRTADHGLLRPWRFLTVQGESLHRLAELFVEATLADAPDTSAAELNSARSKALRAPLILIGIASPKEHPKVPVIEQHLSAGGALQNMLTAAHALDVGAIWRTGPMAAHPVVLQGLGLADHESIIGFIYMGTVDGPKRELRDEPVSNFVQEW